MAAPKNRDRPRADAHVGTLFDASELPASFAQPPEDRQLVDAEEKTVMTEARRTTSSDPLTAEQAKSLLTSVSVIRDPLHGDIRITPLERALIDTTLFQRLRHLQQLAMVDVVYPGATHTRFLHSLGVLHVCSEMILACNNSAKAPRSLAPDSDPIPVKIGPYAELLARMVAMLHDTAHVPFGHVFDKEARVFAKDEWEDPWRVSQIFGPDSEFRNVMRASFIRHFASGPIDERLREKDAVEAADVLLDDVKSTLCAKKDAVYQLKYPFVADLVGNTVCADLIDYIQRDMMYSGLTEGLAKRFMKYLAVLPAEYEQEKLGKQNFELRPYRAEEDTATPREVDKKRAKISVLTLLIYTYKPGGSTSPKNNALPEVIDLVRKRKVLAEKLYFHKSKLVATAMLAGAAHGSGLTDGQRIWNLSDHAVLEMLANTSGEEAPRIRARNLAAKLLKRHLFKPIFRLSYHPDNGDALAIRLWRVPDGVYPRFDDPSKRAELVGKLETLIVERGAQGIGSIAISCPNKDMQLKAFQMRVLESPATPSLRPLQETVRPVVRQEIEVIQRGHQELWSLEVLVDPAVVDMRSELARDLAAACAHVIGMPNEAPDYATVTPRALDELIAEARLNRVTSRYGVRDKISQVHYAGLVSGAARGEADIEAELRRYGYIADK